MSANFNRSFSESFATDVLFFTSLNKSHIYTWSLALHSILELLMEEVGEKAGKQLVKEVGEEAGKALVTAVNFPSDCFK